LIDVEVGGVEHEAALGIDRSAHQHRHVTDALAKADRIGLAGDVELDQEIRHAQIRDRLVDDDAHRPVRRVRAEIDHRAREALVADPRHSHEELAVEIGRVFERGIGRLHGTMLLRWPSLIHKANAHAARPCLDSRAKRV
jgi:hypothetical protein